MEYSVLATQYVFHSIFLLINWSHQVSRIIIWQHFAANAN